MNQALLCDYYEFTMANGYFEEGFIDKQACFDMFFRKIPDNGGFAIVAGIDSFIDYLLNLSFDAEDISYLKTKGIFSHEFLNYLENFKFTCDVYAMPDGTPIFPGEPIITVKGPIIQAQLIETALLLLINHQSLIATKANRIARAALGRPCMEFGARRAHGCSAALYGARAAYIGGTAGTSCTLADKEFHIEALGTMAHSWVQLFPSEYQAFSSYANRYPDNCTLLVDTYNVLKSGVPNAIKTFREVLLPKGKRPTGIRIDSGDLTYLSIKARAMLDQAGFPDCKIVVSGSLDEWIIRDMLIQGAKIDAFGVGERLVTAKSDPVFGGVYKLVGVVDDHEGIIPKIKISENIEKITTPGYKQVYRLFVDGKAVADQITLFDETIDQSKELEIFHPQHTWKKTLLKNFTARKLLQPIFLGGKLVYDRPSLEQTKAYCQQECDNIWDEVKRFEQPHIYYVDLSKSLWSIKNDILYAQNSM